MFGLYYDAIGAGTKQAGQGSSTAAPRHPIAGVEASSTVILVSFIVPTKLLYSRRHLAHRIV